MIRQIVLTTILVAIIALGFPAFVYAQTTGDFWLSKTPLPILVKDSAAVGSNGEIFIMGFNYAAVGNSTSTDNTFNYVYNPAIDGWISRTPMPVLQTEFAIASYQNKIYLLGGWNAFSSGDTYLSKTNQVYDVNKDSWEIKTTMAWPRWGLQANVVKDKMYLIGGMLSQEQCGFRY